jgi:serine/threonine protein kinase
MTTTAFASNDEYVAALSASGLLASEALETVEDFVREHPRRSARDLADYLVHNGIMTRFQTNYLLEGRLADLTIASYTLVDLIGTGAMGTVYKAYSEKEGHCFVRLVPRRNVSSLQAISEKVQALKQVRHPRVSALVNIGVAGEHIFLVWPFLEGGQKLSEVLEERELLSPKQAAQVALQVASGMQPYHEHELFHGLLTTSDILIGTDRRVRVLDFGVGFLLTNERGKAILDTMTNGKTLAVGLDTASPEAILDSLARSPWGDQYSLGCILYRMLTGQFPFPYENPVQKMVAHQSEEPTPVRELCPETPPQLAEVVERLMAKDPEQRYDSIGEVVRELQAILANPRLFDTVAPVPARRAKPKKQADEEEPEAHEEESTPEPATSMTIPGYAVVAGSLAVGIVVSLLMWWRFR